MILNRLEDILICRVDLWTAVPVAAFYFRYRSVQTKEIG